MPTLNSPQYEFLTMPNKFRAFVAGFGSGKTWVGCVSLIRHFQQFEGVTAGYFAPTYGQIRDIFYPTIEEVADDWGLEAEVLVGNREVKIYDNGVEIGLIKCRSMDKPNSIVGFKIGHAVVDEIDTMDMEKAQLAWRKIIARMRYNIEGLKNGIDVTTTPEGFKFVYEQFDKKLELNPSLKVNYGILHASTYDNELNLPDDYINSLIEAYPPELIKAYLNGEFVNLTSGTIYNQFNKKLNNSNEVIREKECLYIGMDFNVGNMTAIIHVKRDGLPHAVEEIVGANDTPDIIRIIKERYWEYKDGNYVKSREIRIYPDASGGGRRSVNASETDLQLLTQAGFYVCANKSNPPVKDRINAVNAMLCNAKNERRYFVNIEKCPNFKECLEQQVWDKNGEPDKKSGKDHANDAAGYFIYYDYPLVKPVFKTSLRSII